MTRPNIDDAARAWDARLVALDANAEHAGGQYATLDGAAGSDIRVAFAGFDVDARELNETALAVAHNSLTGVAGRAGLLGSIAGAYVTGVGVGLMLGELRTTRAR